MGQSLSSQPNAAFDQAFAAIKEATSHLKETYVMWMRMKEWVEGSAVDGGGSWQLSKGFVVPAGEPSNGVLPLNLATWNIWFDNSTKPNVRWSALFDLLLRPSPLQPTPLDVIALQEVTLRSFHLFLSRPDVRKDWIVTDFDDILERSASRYGTLFLVRKDWMAEHGLDKVETSLTRYDTNQGRNLLALEISNPDGVVLRIGTSHFESEPTDTARRQRQFLTAARLLAFPSTISITESPPPSQSTVDQFLTHLSSIPKLSSLVPGDFVPPSILCGDTNIEEYAELDVLRVAPLSFIDTYATANPTPTNAVYSTHSTFGTTYDVPFPSLPKRLDYILARESSKQTSGVKVLAARMVGSEVVRDREGEVRMEGGKEGKLFPSDHLGIIVELEIGRTLASK